ncbi:hypothetical protein MKW98_002852, partial [Papaver atlanticum]
MMARKAGLLLGLSQKPEFTIVFDEMSTNRKIGNGSPAGNGCPHDVDLKRMRCPYHSTTVKLDLIFAVTIRMQAIKNALRGQESESSQEAQK